jgi:hypothetical protein
VKEKEGEYKYGRYGNKIVEEFTGVCGVPA